MDNAQVPQFPLIAELGDLINCLDRMNEKPLKLIADKVCKEFKETLWDRSKWTFVQDNGIVEEKMLLPNIEDTFQFSVANSRSRQDYHIHGSVFEIYVSYSKMEIRYIKDGREHTQEVPSGVLIVPPGVMHQITLHGLSFVFQASVKGAKIREDKEVSSVGL
jgi:hypothetical protein